MEIEGVQTGGFSVSDRVVLADYWPFTIEKFYTNVWWNDFNEPEKHTLSYLWYVWFDDENKPLHEKGFRTPEAAFKAALVEFKKRCKTYIELADSVLENFN